MILWKQQDWRLSLCIKKTLKHLRVSTSLLIFSIFMTQAKIILLIFQYNKECLLIKLLFLIYIYFSLLMMIRAGTSWRESRKKFAMTRKYMIVIITESPKTGISTKWYIFIHPSTSVNTCTTMVNAYNFPKQEKYHHYYHHITAALVVYSNPCMDIRDRLYEYWVWKLFSKPSKPKSIGKI